MSEKTPPVCNYEGSDYQEKFWDQGNREYEDAVEAIALRRLLPPGGKFMLELGAGAGRNTLRYQGFERVALVDYSRTQLEQARDRLGKTDRYVYIAADVYRLPFVRNIFDGGTMIRTLHHMAKPELALQQVGQVMRQGGVFILEFANKRNIKAITRYLLGKQDWNPFDQAPIEFAKLNFDFHPKAIRRYLGDNNFKIERQLTVSHFRMGFLKRHIPIKILTAMDSALQGTGAIVQLSPSVFTRSRVIGEVLPEENQGLFKCINCGEALTGEGHSLMCSNCGSVWEYRDGIYDFRKPANE